MNEAGANIRMPVGRRFDGKSYTEMEYNPDERTVIFRDHLGHEIRLDPESIQKTIAEITAFAAVLKSVGVPTSRRN